ncbi:hypothetical protein BCR37DRAFT_382400, partial [Protomyces lactucae-debilis]
MGSKLRYRSPHSCIRRTFNLIPVTAACFVSEMGIDIPKSYVVGLLGLEELLESRDVTNSICSQATASATEEAVLWTD